MAKANVCPECGGPARGRGFAHKPGCSKASRPTAGAPKADRRMEFPPRASRPAVRADQAGLPDVSGMTIETLVRLRGEIDRVLSSRSDEIRERMDTMQSILDSMEKGKK